MKTNAIVRIVIWSIVLVALVTVMAALIADELYLSSYTPVETVSMDIIEATPVNTLPNEDRLLLNPDSIKEIEIEWVSGDILVMAKDVNQITISESDVTAAKYSMVWQVRGNKLEIDFCEESLTSGFGISFGSDIPTKDLYIYVPLDWAGTSLEIDAASTNVELHNISLNEMDFDGASGTCNFVDCHIQDLDIDTASGDVNYTGTLDTLDFDSASASFIGELQNTPSRIDMDGMSGCLDIALPEDCGYTLSMDGMSSSFRSDFQGTAMKNGSHVYGDGRCRINVDGMSCDVTIRKLETILTATAATEEPTE